jgi:hypothetical protein
MRASYPEKSKKSQKNGTGFGRISVDELQLTTFANNGNIPSLLAIITVEVPVLKKLKWVPIALLRRLSWVRAPALSP